MNAETKSREQELVESAGGEYIGIQWGMVWFNDPQTNSTLAMKLDELTVESVGKKLEASRRAFTANPL